MSIALFNEVDALKDRIDRLEKLVRFLSEKIIEEDLRLEHRIEKLERNRK